MDGSGPSTRVSLPGYAVFAAMLSAAGLPIYIHAPAYYATSYGVGLTALAGVLFALRLVDFVQDPFLGWLSARLNASRGFAVASVWRCWQCRCWPFSPWSRRSRRYCGSGSRWWACFPPSRFSRSRCMQRASRRLASWVMPGI
jgi:hypothetical protein